MTATDTIPPPNPEQEERMRSETTSISGETISAAVGGGPQRPHELPIVEIAIPVYNEEEVLESSIRRLRSYLDHSFPFVTSIVIVDNASIDRTWEIATRLGLTIDGVSAIHLDQKGRGRAIRTAWTASEAEVVVYMDVDLSTDLDGLLPLVAPLLSNHSQVAIGSRIAKGSRVLRGAKREFISRSYNLILRSTLRCHFSDAQCGFKAMRRDAVEPLLDVIEDQHWFFDTELLIQAERSGLRIHEVSVDWIDDPDSRVHIVRTARDDLQGVWRLARQGNGSVGLHGADNGDHKGSAFRYHHEMARYASVGILSTVSYLILFVLLRDHIGMYAANLLAAAVTASANTLAHASFTFRSGQTGQIRQALTVGVWSFLVGIGLTSAALSVTYIIGRTSSTAEGIAILFGLLAASCVRFVLLREWAYRNHTRAIRNLPRSSVEPSVGSPIDQAA